MEGIQAYPQEKELDEEIRDELIPFLNECISTEGARRVPNALRDKCEEAYVPKLVFFRPRQDDVTSPDMKRQTLNFVGAIYENLSSQMPWLKSIHERLASEMPSVESIDEECLGEKEQAWMMIIGATFLLEWMKIIHQTSPGKTIGQSQIVQVLEKFIWDDMVKDLVKLENQVPYSVLEKVFETAYENTDSENNTSESGRSIKPTELVLSACTYFSPFLSRPGGALQPSGDILETLHTYVLGTVPNKKFPKKKVEKSRTAVISTIFEYCCGIVKRPSKDVTDDARHPLVAPIDEESKGSTTQQSDAININPWIRRITQMNQQEGLPSAVELSDAGVRFSPCRRNLNGIAFDEKTCTFHIPPFIMNDMSEITMRNLIALEMCSPSLKDTRAVTSYSHLMNALVNSEEDVQLLKKNRIITNRFGTDDKVVELWTSLTDFTMVPVYDPIDTHVQSLVQLYKKKEWRRWWSEYKRNNCSKPWLVASGVGAVVLLIMTFFQVFCLFYDRCSSLF